MKNISLEKVKPQIRNILEIAFAIIIAVVIEFGMNYPSLTKSYEAVLFSNSGEVNEDGDLVYSQNMDKAVYVNKLKIKAETLEKNSYTVVATVMILERQSQLKLQIRHTRNSGMPIRMLGRKFQNSR